MTLLTGNEYTDMCVKHELVIEQQVVGFVALHN